MLVIFLLAPNLTYEFMKHILTLVENNKVFYVPSLKDYDLLLGISTPLTKIDRLYMPLLKTRCKKKKIKIEIKNYADIEENVYTKIKKKWQFGLFIKPEKTLVEIPRKKRLYLRAQYLVDGLVAFYSSHLFDTEVNVRKFPNKVSFIIERDFNEQRQPEWRSNDN